MALVGISLGSNLGDRHRHLRKAVSRLSELRSGPHLLASGIYETAPVDCPEGSDAFFNAVVEIETDLAPEEFLERTQRIEAEMGRPALRARNAPRPIDLDLLYWDDLVVETGELVLPHPRMRERPFVLIPLAEIRAEYRVPARSLDDTGVTRLELSLL